MSGQALVFVVRNQGYSLFSRAGTATYLAFLLAQVRLGAGAGLTVLLSLMADLRPT